METWGAEIPTHVRNGNSGASYQVDSVNTATDEERLNGFLDSYSEELGRSNNNWLIAGYIPGDIGTSDGITKSLSSANLRNLFGAIFFEYQREKGREGN